MKQIQLGWWVPDRDIHFEEHMKYGGYQTRQRQEILDYIKKRKPITANCIDVGSHVGFWSKDLTEHFKHVYAFEPIPDVRECFKKNVIKNNYTLYNYGLGSEEKKVKVLYNPVESGNTHVSEQGNLEIEIKRLDSFDMLPIDYIKIDAEGYEIEVVKGAQKIIEKDKPFIQIEIKSKILAKQGIDRQEIFDYFKSINYVEVLKTKSEHLFAFGE